MESVVCCNEWMFVEDCLSKGVQNIETHFKVRNDCCEKTHFALFYSTSSVVILQQSQVGLSLFLSISLAVAEQNVELLYCTKTA